MDPQYGLVWSCLVKKTARAIWTKDNVLVDSEDLEDNHENFVSAIHHSISLGLISL
jgi:hypothetical protein